MISGLIMVVVCFILAIPLTLILFAVCYKLSDYIERWFDL